MAINPNDNYTLTGSQVEDLASRIPVITMTSTDPGEGATLAANHFVAVFSAS